MKWFPWYPLEHRRDTYKLSLTEDGAYRRLLDEYMVNRQPLPDDDAALARILVVGRGEEREALFQIPGRPISS